MRILSMIDTLVAAGAERMAVNIANGIAEIKEDSYLCATHSGGPLEEFVGNNVKVFILGKKKSTDLKAFSKLIKFIREEKIELIHAHSTSIYWAAAVKLFYPRIKLIWHDHFGYSDYLNKRSTRVLRLISKRIDHVFAVNGRLVEFSIKNLKINQNSVSFLSNFPDLDFKDVVSKNIDIPDVNSKIKLICLANLRPQKDHNNLLDAFKIILNTFPDARLYLVGGHYNDDYYKAIKNRISNEEILTHKAFILGSRNDVAGILSVCDIGILSSLSEGLPVSLLEYGLAALPVVCTDVGDCSYVLNKGKYGELVAPNKPKILAQSIIKILSDPHNAKQKANHFKDFVMNEFSKKGALSKIHEVYSRLLN